MAAAIEKGIPKLRIEEAAARTQARIDSGEQALVGVNAFRPEQDIEVDVLKVDNAEVRARQLSKLQQLKGTRDVAAVESALDALTKAAQRQRQSARIRHPRRARQRHRRRDLAGAGKGLRPPRRRRCRPFPASTARRSAKIRPSTACRTRSMPSRRRPARKPRILVAKMGQDGHDRGQKVIATAFADLGFDVTVGAMFQTPGGDRQARRRPRRPHRRRLVAGRRPSDADPGTEATRSTKLGRDDILIVAGGVIPPQDYDAVLAAGAAEISRRAR